MKEIPTSSVCLDRAKQMKVEVLKSIRYSNYTSRSILCSNCNYTTEIQDQTFIRWHKKGNIFCGICNGAQKNIPDEVKVAQINSRRPPAYLKLVEVVEYLGYNKETTQAYCTVKFLKCSHTKKYSTTTLGHLFSKGKGLRCDICNSNISCIEQLVEDKYLDESFEIQVPYACMGNTKRRWIADFYSEQLNTIIEVTSGNLQSTEDYSNNIEEKKLWCREQNIEFILINSINNIEDIVRTLEKSRECT